MAMNAAQWQNLINRMQANMAKAAGNAATVATGNTMKKVFWTTFSVSRLPVQSSVTPRNLVGLLTNTLGAGKFGVPALIATTAIQAYFKYWKGKQMMAEFTQRLNEYEPFQKAMAKAGNPYVKMERSIYVREGEKLRVETEKFKKDIRGPWERLLEWSTGIESSAPIEAGDNYAKVKESLYDFATKEQIPPAMREATINRLLNNQGNMKQFYRDLMLGKGGMVEGDAILRSLMVATLVKGALKSSGNAIMNKFAGAILAKNHDGETEDQTISRLLGLKEWSNVKDFVLEGNCSNFEQSAKEAAVAYGRMFPGKIDADLRKYQQEKLQESVQRSIAIRKISEEKADTMVGNPATGYFIQQRRRTDEFIHNFYHTRMEFGRNKD